MMAPPSPVASGDKWDNPEAWLDCILWQVVKGTQKVYEEGTKISQNTANTIKIQIDNSIKSIKFDAIVGWIEGEKAYGIQSITSPQDIQIALVKPDGTIIDQTSQDGSITYTSSDGYISYYIDSPMSGEWQIVIGGVDIEGETSVLISVLAETDITLSLELDKEEYAQKNPIIIKAQLLEKGQSKQQASVFANIEKPTGTETMILYDDGNHGDNVANDGIYGNIFTNTLDQGLYTFRVYADGTSSSGDSFSRVAMKQVTVRGDPSYFLIDCPETTTTKGSFTLTVVACNSQGATITTYSGTASLRNKTDSISPKEIAFSNGVWSGSAEISKSPNHGTDTIIAKLGNIIGTKTIKVFVDMEDQCEIIEDNVKLIVGTRTKNITIHIFKTTPTPPSGITFVDAYEIRLIDEEGKFASQTGTSTIYFYFQENIGFVDGIRKEELLIFMYDNKWETLTTQVIGTYAFAYIPHFSIFALGGTKSITIANDLTRVIAYPNPCKQYPRITFTNLTDQCRIRIYNIARELIFEQEYTNTNGKVSWDTKNKEGKPVASGVYIYLITNPNNKEDKAIGKIGIIK